MSVIDTTKHIYYDLDIVWNNAFRHIEELVSDMDDELLTVFYRTNIMFWVNSFHQSVTAATLSDQESMNSV